MKMTPNKKRMHAYAKAGGLNAFRDGGSVLDNSDGVITNLAKAAAKVAKSFAKKVVNVSNNYAEGQLQKTPELKRQVRRVIANQNYKPKGGR